MSPFARPCRAARRRTLRAALAAAYDERASRLRDALDERLTRPGEVGTPPGDEVLVLGRGTVGLALADSHGAVCVDDAPLAVKVRDGVTVLGPPRLAEMVAEAYREQLEGRYGARDRTAIITAAHGSGAPPHAARPGALRAEVWLGPDGTALARTPTEARGRWVPLEVRL